MGRGLAAVLAIAAVAILGPVTAWALINCSSQGSDLPTGSWLYASSQQCLSTNSGEFKFVMQSDGNFVLYYQGSGGAVDRALWASGTSGSIKGIVMQSDGNLVIYNNSMVPVWASNTGGKGASNLVDQYQDGNQVIYINGGGPTWATSTNFAVNTESFDAGDCWRSGTPLMCRNTWASTKPYVYFRAIDHFSTSSLCGCSYPLPNYSAPAQSAVSAWDGTPGPQFYSFTPTTNDTWNYLQASITGQHLLGSQIAGITELCDVSGLCWDGAAVNRSMNVQWANIYFNSNDQPADSQHIESLVMHESGHAMLLAHNDYDNSSIMNENATINGLITVGANDIGNSAPCGNAGFGLRCIYDGG